MAAGTTANKPADTARSTVHNVECLPDADCNGADTDIVREIYWTKSIFICVLIIHSLPLIPFIDLREGSSEFDWITNGFALHRLWLDISTVVGMLTMY